MKKLTLSLIAALLSVIILLGWSLDTFFNQYQGTQKNDEFAPYIQMISALANTLDATKNTQDFVTTWQQTNAVQLALTPLAEFPLPVSLQQDFEQGNPLFLESEEAVTLSQLLPSQQQVLTLSLPLDLKKTDNFGLQVALTTIFYTGVLFCMFIWLYPLIKRLQLLRHTAKAFGEGQFSKRISIKSSSYIVDIENEFNRMAQKIETLVEDNKLLSNAVSHDLRTPLARLRFGIEALSETTNPKNQEKYMQRLSQDIQEMENLVNVLLSYARLEQKMVEIERKPVDLNGLIARSVEQLTTDHSRNIRFNTKGLTPNGTVVKGDEKYLSMLVNNLLSNAQRFAHRQVNISSQIDSQNVSIKISDDGPGIAPELRETLFKPFVRGDKHNEPVGYGMGLAIVARITDWHSGKVEIGQAENLGGAEFTLTFRLHDL